MTKLVEFRSIQKTYDNYNLVVKNLNLEIEKGEFLTMLGPSGSGKTTSLMMLAGFETPTRGDILLQNRPLNNLPPHQRDIGMVFQTYALFPHMTVAENLAFPLKVRKMSQQNIIERVDKVLGMIQLRDLADRYPAQMSGGQQQRVALGRALIFEPTLILMDEPLGALDKQLREHMQMEIRRLHKMLGLTVVYVTHDQSEAMTMSDRVAVFNDGVIQQLATPSTLYEEPENSFVAGFIGENNRLLGINKGRDGDYYNIELSDGTKIKALKVRASSPGNKINLSIRPERVKINQDLKPNEQQVIATIDQFVYLGDHIRILTTVSDQTGFMIKINPEDITQDLKVGKKIKLSWQPKYLRSLDVCKE